MALVDSLKKIPTTLLNTFGSTGTIQRVTQTGREPGGKVILSTATAAVNFIDDELTASELALGNERPFDRRVIVSADASSFQPTTDDKLIIGGRTYDIKSVAIVALQDTDVLYTLTLSGTQ